MDNSGRQDDPPRTAIPMPHASPWMFSQADLVAYLRTERVRVVEYRGRLWRNSAAPSRIAGHDWVPLRRWDPVPAGEAGFPSRTALAYRCLAADSTASTFPFVVFRGMRNYGAQRLTRHRARQVRRSLERYEFVVLDGPDLLLKQGWDVASRAAADSGMRLPRDEAEYRRRVTAAFAGTPPVVWAGLSDGRLAGYGVTYATGVEAMFEKIYIAPEFRDRGVGVGLYWNVVAGWAKVPGVRNVWTGGTLPGRGVDSFKLSMGAVLENVAVHAGMRAPLAMALRRVKPDAVSLGALNG